MSSVGPEEPGARQEERFQRSTSNANPVEPSVFFRCVEGTKTITDKNHISHVNTLHFTTYAAAAPDWKECLERNSSGTSKVSEVSVDVWLFRLFLSAFMAFDATLHSRKLRMNSMEIWWAIEKEWLDQFGSGLLSSHCFLGFCIQLNQYRKNSPGPRTWMVRFPAFRPT